MHVVHGLPGDVERELAGGRPGPRDFWAGEVGQRSNQQSKAAEKGPIEVEEPEEPAEAGLVGGLLELQEPGDVLLEGADAVGRDLMAEELHPGREEGALRGVYS